MSVTAYQSPHDPNRCFLDFDLAAPGGLGGAGILIDPANGMVSIDGVHRNDLLPKRSTGGLLAAGLKRIGVPRPPVIECYNVEKSTAAVLIAGRNGRGTLIGNMIVDLVAALGGTIQRWETIKDAARFDLRVHVTYP